MREKEVLIGRSECRSADLPVGRKKHAEVAAYGVMALCTDSFVNLMRIVDDGETERKIGKMLQDLLIEETKKFLDGLNVLILSVKKKGTPIGSSRLSIGAFLTNTNKVRVRVEWEFDNLVAGLGAEAGEKFMTQMEAHQMMYENCYSKEFRENWEKIIDFIFREPEKCKEFVRDMDA